MLRYDVTEAGSRHAFTLAAGAAYAVPREPVRVEPDASSATYFAALAAVTGTTVELPGIGSRSCQGEDCAHGGSRVVSPLSLPTVATVLSLSKGGYAS